VIVTICAGALVDTGTMPKSSAGRATVMMVGWMTVIVNGALPVQPFAAVARTENVNGPSAVGVPVMVPAAARFNPFGSKPPLSVNEYGALPPLAVRVPRYSEPRAAPGSDPETVIAGQAALPVNGTEVEPDELVIVNVAFRAPSAVGWNTTPTDVDAPPASVVVAGAPTAKSDAFEPEMMNGGVSTVGVGSVFWIGRNAFAVAPGSRLPKSTDDGDTAIPPAPVPESATFALPPPLVAIVIVADLPPPDVGWNETAIVAVAFGASVISEGAPAVKEAASVPVNAAGFRLIVAAGSVPAIMFFTVTVKDCAAN
jgi:hypothetical protein